MKRILLTTGLLFYALAFVAQVSSPVSKGGENVVTPARTIQAKSAEPLSIEGTPFDISYTNQVIPDDAPRTYTFSGQYQSLEPSIRSFNPTDHKQIVVLFAEPLTCSYNVPYKNAGGEQQWNACGGDQTGWTAMEINVNEVMTEFCIQNTKTSPNSFTITDSYVVKNDESEVPLTWTPSSWGPSVSVSGITSGEATISKQWDGVNMTAPDCFLQEGTKTLRIYTNNDMTDLPFQWSITDADGDTSYPKLGVDETGKYAEFSTDALIKSLYLQHTGTEAHTLDIIAITWEFKKATYEPAVLVLANPVTGSKVDIDTEYTFTFSQPVTYAASLSGIAVGTNYFSDGNSAIFTQSTDGKAISVKLDKEGLALYNVNNTDQLISMMGTNVKVTLWRVKDAKTGQVIEGCYDVESEDPAYVFSYSLGDPVLDADPIDGQTIESLKEVSFTCAEGIELNTEATLPIMVMCDKELAASVALDDLTPQTDIDNTIVGYTMTLDTELIKAGSYEVYVPVGTFILNGNPMASAAIFTYTIEDESDETDAIAVNPAEGTVTELTDITFTYGGQYIVPSYKDDKYILITDAAGNEVATITQDDLNSGGYYAEDAEPFDETIGIKVNLDNAIAAAGTYTMTIPMGAFYLGNDYQLSPEMTITWTVKADEPLAEFTLTDGETYNQSKSFQVETLTYSRNFLNTGYQALYVPFAMQYSDWSAKADVYELLNIFENDTDDNGIVDNWVLKVVKMKAGSSIEPNTPYIIKPKTTGNMDIVLTDAMLYAKASNSIWCASTRYCFYFTGTYQPMTIAANSYFAMAGGSLQYTETDVQLGAQRWYMEIRDKKTGSTITPSVFNESHEVRAISIFDVDEDDETSIHAAYGAEMQSNSVVYNLNGQRLSAPAKGVNIINGRKVVVK